MLKRLPGLVVSTLRAGNTCWSSALFTLLAMAPVSSRRTHE